MDRLGAGGSSIVELQKCTEPEGIGSISDRLGGGGGYTIVYVALLRNPEEKYWQLN